MNGYGGDIYQQESVKIQLKILNLCTPSLFFKAVQWAVLGVIGRPNLVPRALYLTPLFYSIIDHSFVNTAINLVQKN